MITKISLQGFKSIKNIEDLELGLINVFIGANGSGKSNILEAVGMLSAAAEGYVDAKHLLERGVRHSVPALYKTSLKGTYQPFIVLKAYGNQDGTETIYEVKLNNSVETPEDAWNYEHELFLLDNIKIIDRKHISKISGPSGLKNFLLEFDKNKNMGILGSFDGFKKITILNNYKIFMPTTPVLRGLQPDIVPIEPVGLLGGRLAEAVEDILDLENEAIGSLDLDEVLDLLDWVDEFDITGPSRELLSPNVPSLRSVVRFKDYWMDKKRNQLSGYDASEGALYVLFMLVLALHPRTPKFFAVDNFDQAMNPRLVRALTRLFCKIIIESDPPRQAMLTTHNPMVLDGLDLRDDRIRLFAVERNHSTGGATRASRVILSDKILESGEKGTPLSMMWVTGLLGGVPDIF
ncbi:MAG: ATP-binding protein [Desulfobacteraceae bacterium]|nr:ATP-binding protein [Desulfobacteraceae bacterium]